MTHFKRNVNGALGLKWIKFSYVFLVPFFCLGLKQCKTNDMDTRYKRLPKKTKEKIYVPKDSYFVSFDESLYTSIPNPEGIKTVKTSMENYQNRTEVTKVITTLLALIPTLNNFTFNNKKLHLTLYNSNNGKLHTNPC